MARRGRGVPAADRRRRGVPGRTLIAATGSFARPHQPRFPGQEAFRGKILHAAEYRNPIPFRGKRVVIVGGGNSAVQIAHELVEVAETTSDPLLSASCPSSSSGGTSTSGSPSPASTASRSGASSTSPSPGRRGRRDLRRRGALRKTRPAAGVLPLHRKRRGLGGRARGAGGRRPSRHRLRPEPGLHGALGRREPTAIRISAPG